MLDATINKFGNLLLAGLLVLGVVLNTSIGNLHGFTPKVVGF
jgi:hypothetical protein